MRLTSNGLLAVSFPQLSSPMEIDLIPTGTVYDSRRYYRICEFKTNEDPYDCLVTIANVGVFKTFSGYLIPLPPEVTVEPNTP